MAKGKRPTKGKSTAKKEKKFDGGGSRVKAVNTWDEMEHDSEDEFHDSRSAILLDHEKELQSRYNDDSEGSEEEVFGLDEEEEEEEEDEDDLGDLDGDFGDADDADEPDLDKVSWGKSKRSYYNAEEVESDEETAKAEEEEALRLQKKRLAQMSEEDFAPEEEDAWGAAGRGALEGFDRELAGIELLKADQGGIIVEKIAKAGASKLSKQEIMKVLQNQSPELVDLVEEFKEKSEILQALAEVLQMVAALPKPFPETQAPLPFLRLKYSTLINYLTNIAFYITLKTTPNAESVDLRDHPVIDALLELKTSIGKLEKLEGKKVIQESMEDLLEILETGGEDESESEDDEDEELRRLEAELAKAKKAAKSKKEKKSKTGKKDDAAPAKEEFVYDVEFEDDFVSYNDKTKKGGKKTTKSISASKKREQLDNDYGDLDELLDVDLEDKAQKKRSLRDYVSKIDQKSNKRSKILKGSGDSDIPYREKFKDRQEQMKRQAAKSAPEPENTELDDLDWDAKDKAAARHVGGDGNDDDIFSGEERSGRSSGGSMQVRDGEEYYEQVLQDRESKKAARKALNENIEQSTSFEDTNIDPNDKRSVTWQILKNKGLTPHRKKEQRNPRVKNRKKYETAKKKIKSVKRVFTRLEGAYGGEKTGIKTGLARSVKFS
ncbi:hypothetical protein BGW38_000569 [Lunasporangiospora selenospora]|uniref:Sas10 C-terminal domain-containing protein n=1 Tax=Lunasporangiospora selenospora TaxID=979761 RepID=A0A9P6KEQ4_9FUNG|nr:hypothetical protein BGW38_000569 [Lunasporangiospora selenospora]